MENCVACVQPQHRTSKGSCGVGRDGLVTKPSLSHITESRTVKHQWSPHINVALLLLLWKKLQEVLVHSDQLVHSQLPLVVPLLYVA